MGDRPEKIPVPQITKYLDHPGDQTIPIRQWMTTFEQILIIIDASRTTKLTSAEKNAILYVHLGMEGSRILQANPIFQTISTTTWGNFRQAVVNQFQTPTSIVKAQYEFQNRRQEPSETVEEFITVIRQMAVDCDFGEATNNRIAIQLIAGCKDTKSRQLCLRLDQINLDQVIRILRTEEVADITTQAVGTRRDTGVSQVSVRGRGRGQRQQPRGRGTVIQPRRGGLTPNFGQSTSPIPSNQPSRRDTKCQGCGRFDHPRSQCPARDQECNFCKLKGHFARVCRKKNTQTVNTTTNSLNQDFSIDPQAQIIMSAVQPKIKEYFQISDGTQFQDVKMEIDTGADTTTVTEKVYNQLFRNLPLIKRTQPLRNYDGSVIKGIWGQFKSKIHIYNRTHQEYIQVVPNNYNCIIGRNFLQPLDIIVDCSQYRIRDGRQLNQTQVQQLHQTSTPIDWTQMIKKQFPRFIEETIGTYPEYQHHIKVDINASPTVARCRTVPIARREAVKKEILEMERLGIWEKVNESRWIHPMVTVPKPDGSIRITTDLSPVNPAILPTHHPIPNIKDLFLQLETATVFSKLDIKKGYFHIQLHPESRRFTTTITPEGLFQYLRLPMGLKDSAQAFQRCMATTVVGLPGVIAYIDDLLIFGKNQKEHDENLWRVLEKLHLKDFRLNLKKCQFSQRKIGFLGHVIQNGTITPDPSNIRPIKQVGTPINKREVQTFLGMVNFYAEYIRDIASLAEPLRALTRKETPFSWTKECQVSFETLKAVMADQLALHIFDPSAKTILTTDASDVGIGAVLSQVQRNKEVPIAFASHTLSPTERNYATNEREAWAAIWAMEHFEKFLLGRRFTLRTDHQALKSLLITQTSRRTSAKFTRWIERLAPFDYTVEYHPGSQNQVADALSRLRGRAQEYGIRNIRGSITTATIKENTKDDPLLQKIISFLGSHWPKKSTMETEVKNFFQVKDQLVLRDNILFRQHKIVAPESLHRTILQEAHRGHPGIVRMKRKLRETYWWRGLDKQVEHFVDNCLACQASDKTNIRNIMPPQLSPLPRPDCPAVEYAMDITGPFPDGQSIIVLIDLFSIFQRSSLPRTPRLLTLSSGYRLFSTDMDSQRLSRQTMDPSLSALNSSYS